MDPRAVVLSLVVLPVAVWASMVFAAEQGTLVKGAPTSAQAANAEIAAVLKKKTKVGSHIKVADARGEHIGRLIQVMDNAVNIDEGTGTEYIPLIIPFENVEAVSKRSANTGTGALVGGGVGVVVGLLIGLAAASDPFFEDDAGAVTVASVFLVGAVGTGLGALVGSMSHSYSIIYKR